LARRPRWLHLLAGAILAAATAWPGAGAELPSPDAMWLGQRIVPQAIVDGYRAGLERNAIERVVGAGVAAVDQPALTARGHARMAPVLDEAFPPELLAGAAAEFLAGHYTAAELRDLRAREDSPLGRKLRDFSRQAVTLPAQDPAARDRAREALARATFTAPERKELDELAASPLGRKGEELALPLAGFFLERLERRWAEVRAELEPRLLAAARAAREDGARGG
jgi:hypothetical protein